MYVALNTLAYRLIDGFVALRNGSLRSERGQTFTEYAIIVATIAVGTVAAVGTLRNAVTDALADAANDI